MSRYSIPTRLGQVAIIALTAAGCSSGTTPSVGVAPVVGPAKLSRPIASTCGYKILIPIHTSRPCHFNEAGYKGKFTIQQFGDHPYEVSPLVGKGRTIFTITADYGGSGYFTVSDKKNNEVKVTVRVTQ